MKFINKLRIGIPRLEAWKEQEDERLTKLYRSQRADAAWSHLPSKPNTPHQGKIDYSKLELKASLNKEQGFLCCYCQRRIGTRDRDHDIEHLIPKSANPKKYTFEYANLCVSCKYEPYIIARNRTEVQRPLNDATCNEVRGSIPLLILPTDEDVESKFRYADDGKISSVYSNAIEAIRILNLNSDRLVKLRKNAIEAVIFIDIFDERIADNVTLRKRLNLYSQKKNGKHTEVRQAILYAINNRLVTKRIR